MSILVVLLLLTFSRILSLQILVIVASFQSCNCPNVRSMSTLRKKSPTGLDRLIRKQSAFGRIWYCAMIFCWAQMLFCSCQSSYTSWSQLVKQLYFGCSYIMWQNSCTSQPLRAIGPRLADSIMACNWNRRYSSTLFQVPGRLAELTNNCYSTKAKWFSAHNTLSSL